MPSIPHLQLHRGQWHRPSFRCWTLHDARHRRPPARAFVSRRLHTELEENSTRRLVVEPASRPGERHLTTTPTTATTTAAPPAPTATGCAAPRAATIGGGYLEVDEPKLIGDKRFSCLTWYMKMYMKRYMRGL